MRLSVEILSRELEKKRELFDFHQKLMNEGNTLYKASFEKQSQLSIEIESLSQDIATLNSTHIVADLMNTFEFHKASQISPPQQSITHQGGVIIERN